MPEIAGNTMTTRKRHQR